MINGKRQLDNLTHLGRILIRKLESSRWYGDALFHRRSQPLPWASGRADEEAGCLELLASVPCKLALSVDSNLANASSRLSSLLRSTGRLLTSDTSH